MNDSDRYGPGRKSTTRVNTTRAGGKLCLLARRGVGTRGYAPAASSPYEVSRPSRVRVAGLVPDTSCRDTGAARLAPGRGAYILLSPATRPCDPLTLQRLAAAETALRQPLGGLQPLNPAEPALRQTTAHRLWFPEVVGGLPLPRTQILPTCRRPAAVGREVRRRRRQVRVRRAGPVRQGALPQPAAPRRESLPRAGTGRRPRQRGRERAATQGKGVGRGQGGANKLGV